MTSEKIAAKGMNVLIYGRQGSGKTYLAATAQDHPQMKDVLFLNIEGGMMTLGSRGDISAVDVRTVEDMEAIIYSLRNDKSFGHFRTIVIDSLTEWSRIDLEHIVRDWGTKRKPDEIQLMDYNTTTIRTSRLIRAFRDMPLNVIITCLEKEQKESIEGGKIVAVRPALTEVLCNYIMSYMDAVWYLYTREEGEGDNVVTVRKLLFENKGVFRAKTRGVGFAEALRTPINNPTMPQLFDLYIQSEKTETKGA